MTYTYIYIYIHHISPWGDVIPDVIGVLVSESHNGAMAQGAFLSEQFKVMGGSSRRLRMATSDA